MLFACTSRRMYGVRQRDADSYFSSMVVEYGPSVSAQLKEQVPL